MNTTDTLKNETSSQNGKPPNETKNSIGDPTNVTVSNVNDPMQEKEMLKNTTSSQNLNETTSNLSAEGSKPQNQEESEKSSATLLVIVSLIVSAVGMGILVKCWLRSHNRKPYRQSYRWTTNNDIEYEGFLNDSQLE